MRSQLMCLARLLRDVPMGRTSETLYFLGNSYPLKGLGSRLKQRTCLIWFLPQGLYLTSRDIQKVSDPKSSFARPWKWKDNLVGSRL